ncbi:MAG TPA: hypothetical protein VFK33_13175 [Bacillales bacterium]|nr:hypothetical protein [Bacillales bacterium]
MAACGQSDQPGENVAQAAAKQKDQKKDTAKQANPKKKSEQKKDQQKDSQKVVITSDVLKKIDKQFNTDLPFDKNKHKKLMKRNSKYGLIHYKNGSTVTQDGQLDSIEDGKMYPFEEKMYVRATLAGMTNSLVPIKNNGKDVPNGHSYYLPAGPGHYRPSQFQEVYRKAWNKSDEIKDKTVKVYHHLIKNDSEHKIDVIGEVMPYASKYSPALEQYLKKTKAMLLKAKDAETNKDYRTYLKASKRLFSLIQVIANRKHVKMK